MGKSEKENNEWMKYVSNKELLSENLIYLSLFISVYESMKDYVVNNVKSLLCTRRKEDEKIKFVKTDEYKKEIEGRVVDEEGNHDSTKASFLFLVDLNIISMSDYNDFLKMKDTRNKYAHEMLQLIASDINIEEIKLFLQMVQLYKKITKNWFIEVEASILGIQVTDNMENIVFTKCLAIDIALNVLYNNKAGEYKKIFEEYGETDK